MAFSSRDVDRLGRQIEAFNSNPVTRQVIDSAPIDCLGKSLTWAMNAQHGRERIPFRGRGRFSYRRYGRGYGRYSFGGRGRGFGRGNGKFKFQGKL